jgi:hypothetical protein
VDQVAAFTWNAWQVSVEYAVQIYRILRCKEATAISYGAEVARQNEDICVDSRRHEVYVTMLTLPHLRDVQLIHPERSTVDTQ